MEQRTGEQPEMSSSSSRIDWVRQPLQQARPSVVVYAIPEVPNTIRATLHKIGGDPALESFRSGCFGHFLDYSAGVVQKKAIHGLMSREVRMSDRALEGRETWFQIHHFQLRFGPTEYNLVSDLRFDSTSIDPNAEAHVVPQRSVFYRLFEGKRTTVKHLKDQFKAQAIARDAPDYVKVANILFAYRMILCLDQNRAVDPWVWALATGYRREKLRAISFLRADLGTSASYYSSSAVDDVGPSSRGTRVARTPQKKVVDAVMSHVRELIDMTIAPRVQEYVDRAIDRELAGLSSRARRSPTPEIRDRHRMEPSDRSAALRAPTLPSQSALQPIVEQEVIQLYFNGDRLWQSWFDKLEDPSTELKDFHMSYFLSGIARRVRRDNGCPTMVANTGLYESLVGVWKILHPLDPQCRGAYGDSLLYQMDNPSGRVHYERRDRELMPLLRLLPRLLICAGFWEGHQIPSRCAFVITLDKSISDQYM
ncbi:hypothetical protein C2S52_017716 [Perilla frutescens var. hirtella]|nr:hypothetical protein C2S52_017716 [Perilla frutescens var. hirtella]